MKSMKRCETCEQQVRKNMKSMKKYAGAMGFATFLRTECADTKAESERSKSKTVGLIHIFKRFYFVPNQAYA